MENINFSLIGLFLLIFLAACSSDQIPDSLPEPTEDATSCVADGPNCKQFNPNL